MRLPGTYDLTYYIFFLRQDINKNGKIMFTEFLAATIEAHGHIQEDRIAEAFDRLDADDTGFISRKNLREVLGKGCSSEEINAIMSSADKDKDGQISYQVRVVSQRIE